MQKTIYPFGKTGQLPTGVGIVEFNTVTQVPSNLKPHKTKIAMETIIRIAELLGADCYK